MNGFAIASRIVSEPAAEPLSLAEARAHLHVTHTEDDEYLIGLITTARVYVEMVTGRALVTQTWKAWYAGFEKRLVIPWPRLQSVETVRVRNSAGAWATLETSVYSVDSDVEPGAVVEAYGATWPSITLHPVNPIEIAFTAGYGAAAAVPRPLKQAMLLLIGHWYEHREAVIVPDRNGAESKLLELGAMRLIENFRAWGTR